MTSLIDSENGVDREALAAWHEDRRGWSAPFFCDCGQPAVAKLVYIWREDGSEQGKSRPKCREHYHAALDLWQRLQAAAPDAVDGLTVAVAAP